jgi:hypothetical protein
MIHKNLILFFSLSILLLLGFLYTYFIQVNISNIKVLNNDKTKYNFNINSKIEQNIELHVGTKAELNSLYCEEEQNSFTYYRGYDHKQQEEVSLKLRKGLNHCQLKTVRVASSTPILKQKISFIDALFLFVFFIVPLFHLLFIVFITLVNKAWRKKNV